MSVKYLILFDKKKIYTNKILDSFSWLFLKLNFYKQNPGFVFLAIFYWVSERNLKKLIPNDIILKLFIYFNNI